MRRDSVLLAALVATAACAPPRVVNTPVPTPAPGAPIRYAVRGDPMRLRTVRLVALDADRMVVERFVPSPTRGAGHRVRDTLATDSVAHLQVKVGRRTNAGRGALIGAGVGGALGLLCAAGSGGEDSWAAPSAEECLVSGPFSGALMGLLVGALRRSDVWAPVVLPVRDTVPMAPPLTRPPAVSVDAH